MPFEMAWPLGIKLEDSRYFTAFRPASNDEEDSPHEKKEGKKMGKRSEKLNFIFLMKGFSYLDVCLSLSQVITVKIPPL